MGVLDLAAVPAPPDGAAGPVSDEGAPEGPEAPAEDASDGVAPPSASSGPGEDAPGTAPEDAPEPSFIPIPMPTGSDDDGPGLWEVAREVIPVLPASRTGNLLGLLGAMVVAALGASFTRRLRDLLPRRGLFPRLLQVLHTVLRLLVLGLVIALGVGLLPSWMGPALPWVLLAAAVAVGWSARDLLPDVVARVVLLFERRIRRGEWISGEHFSGAVVGMGLRATTVVDARGHRILVPNRRLLSAPIVSTSAVGAEHEVTLRMEHVPAAARVRQALHDAVLQSPWVPPGAAPIVLRDTDEPNVWHVRTRLLEARHAPRFEGELLERAEEILAHGSTSTFPLDEELDDA
ncbi:MAG: mechanosensitive ion channel domain-containing protein [Myxococcota bacterium]